MARNMYTWGSAEGVQAAINELPGRFDLGLTADDMEAVIRSLAYAIQSDACDGENGNPDDHEMIGGIPECLDGCWRRRAENTLGSIVENLNVDWV